MKDSNGIQNISAPTAQTSDEVRKILKILELHPAYQSPASFWASMGKFIRWREWADGKQGLIHAFAWLNLSLNPTLSIVPTLIALCLSTIAIMWAYLLNATTDREEDKVVGKFHPFAELPWFWQSFALVGIPTLLILVWYLAELDIPRGAGLFGILLCGCVYSCRPLRGKTHWLWGPTLAAVGQRNCVLLLVTGWFPWDGWVQATAHLLCLLVGMRWIFVHQVQDCDADRQAGVNTTATILGQERMRWLVETGFWLEVLSLIGIALLGGRLTSGVWYVALLWLTVNAPLSRFWWEWSISDRLYRTAFAPLHDLYHATAPVVLVWHLSTVRPIALPIAALETLLAAKFISYYLNLYRAAHILPQAASSKPQTEL